MIKTNDLLPNRSFEISLNALPLLMAAMFALTGCSSAKMNIDSDQVRAKTFSFIAPGSRTVPNYADNRQVAHTMIQQAITGNLAAKGVSQVASGGDVTVAYLVIIGNNASTTSLNSYFGDTADSAALVEKVHDEQTSSDSRRGYFEAGTLVIDFVDPKTSKTLQRRSIQADVLRNLSPETRAARIQAIVDKALADVKVSN